MKRLVIASILSVAFICSPTVQAQSEAHARLPEAVPADFPFPPGSDLSATAMNLSGGKQVVVSCTFSNKAATVYKTFKQYAVDHGYEIAVENAAGLSFSSRNGSSSKGLGVRIADMGSIKVATVTFFVPGK